MILTPVSYAENVNALGTGPITMADGTVIIARNGLGTYDFTQGLTLSGASATIWGGISTSNHNTTKSFSGGISGSGKLIYNGVNGTWFDINTANPSWTGGLETADPQNQRHRLRASADGAFGTGDVTINNNCSLVINSGLSDTIDDAATLSINGVKSSDEAAKLNLGSNESVDAFFIDGLQVNAGAYH